MRHGFFPSHSGCFAYFSSFFRDIGFGKRKPCLIKLSSAIINDVTSLKETMLKVEKAIKNKTKEILMNEVSHWIIRQGRESRLRLRPSEPYWFSSSTRLYSTYIVFDRGMWFFLIFILPHTMMLSSSFYIPTISISLLIDHWKNKPSP